MRDSRFQGIWFSVLSRFCYGYNPTLFKKKNKMLNARFIFVEYCRVEIQVLQSDELNFSHNRDNWILGFGQWKAGQGFCLSSRTGYCLRYLLLWLGKSALREALFSLQTSYRSSTCQSLPALFRVNPPDSPPEEQKIATGTFTLSS